MKKINKFFLAGVLCLLAASSGCAKQQITSETEQNPSDIGIRTISDLEGKRIGTQIGTTGLIYAEDIPGAQMQSFTKPSAALKALKENKIDAVILDNEPAKTLTADDEAFRILYEALVEEEYSIAYAKDNTELGKQIDDALSSLKEDGTLEKITSHWIGEDADQIPYHPDKSVPRNGTLIMATNAEFPPYESKTSSGEIVGIDVDMMNAVCDKIGMNLEIKDMPFDSVLVSVQNGKADVGVAGISVTPERQEEVAFSQSYAVSKLVVVVRNE